VRGLQLCNETEAEKLEQAKIWVLGRLSLQIVVLCVIFVFLESAQVQRALECSYFRDDCREWLSNTPAEGCRSKSDFGRAP
jgi:hypothetical protein